MPDDYQIPPYGVPGDRLHAFLMQKVADGEAWLGSQRPTTEWEAVDRVLGPNYAGGTPAEVGQSQVGYNLVRHLFSEIRATLSGFKHAGEVKPTEDDAQELFDRAHMLSNLDEHWENISFANETIRAGVGMALGKGTAYFYEDWDRSAHGPNRGDIRMRAVDPSDVTFIDLPRTHDIQQAYMVLIREELPLQVAKRMYASNPTFANGLRADRESNGAIAKGFRRVNQFVASIAGMTGGTGRMRRNDDASTQFVDIWHAYTMDGSINDGTGPRQMGAPGTNWSYAVPALGDPIPQGVVNPATGQPWTLPATADDCLLFPLRRLSIFARTGVHSDGSSPWWHGDVPLARVRFNDLPSEALGASQMGDAIKMQDGIIALMRIIEDAAAARLDPPVIYSENMDKAWAEGFNPRKAGVRVSADLTQGSPVEFPVPPQYYDVPQWITGEGGFIRQQEDRIARITSAQDLIAVAKARQIPSSDTLEKLMEMAGPVVQDMFGALVKPLTQLGTWRIAYFFQFYTRQRMLTIADPDGVELTKDVKYVPEKLAPYILGETPDARNARVRSYLHDFRYVVTESGVSEMNRMSQTLLYVQLIKALDFPISPWTLAKIAKVPNMGPPPVGTNTEMERWIAWKKILADLQVELAQQVQEATGGEAPAGGGKPAVGSTQQGRPASFSRPARMVSKDGGTRSSIVTS